MTMFSCFSPLFPGKKKGAKESKRALDSKKSEAIIRPRVEPIDHHRCESEENNVIKEAPFDPLPAKSKLTSNGNLVQGDSGELDVAYEGGDEHDEILSMRRDYSDLDLQPRANSIGSNHEFIQLGHESLDNKSERDDAVTPELSIQSGHVSDPGMARKTARWGSPVLKRSCSNIETKRRDMQAMNSPMKSQSYTDLKNLSSDRNSRVRIQSSPLSVRSNCSADRVMLKKRSSSQVLPSRSRKVWWKLFLWSHRNLHKPPPPTFSKPPVSPLASHHQAGYSSDTLVPNQTLEKRKKKAVDESGNQWVAFAMDSSSPFDRVNAWVNSIEENELGLIRDDYTGDSEGEEENKSGFVLPVSQEIGEPSEKNHSSHKGRRTTEEIVQANNVIQSLNSMSSIAHISGMGLKVIPSISAFSSLRSINLSGNYIVHINSGSLPKSLHMLDLSRNKITTIEGLRELTRLRVLNLSYNRIARIGHGLSNCTLIKELYLAGNKISDVEGLHRLLKLTILDLSFNKITTSKALGQLVANYHSLVALNLIGNPIQANIGDDQLRKTASSLLPRLTYLNKQPIKPQRAREAATDSIAKAALGSGSTGGRRMVRRASQRLGVGSLARRASQSPGAGSVSGHHKRSRHGSSKGRHQHTATSSRK